MQKKQSYTTPALDIIRFEKEEVVTMNVSGLDASDYEKDNKVLSIGFRKFVSDKMKQCAGTPAMERLRSAFLP